MTIYSAKINDPGLYCEKTFIAGSSGRIIKSSFEPWKKGNYHRFIRSIVEELGLKYVD